MKRALSLQATILAATLLAGSAGVSSALPIHPAALKLDAESAQKELLPVRAGRGGGFARGGGYARRGGVAVGPRGGMVARGGAAAVGPRRNVVTRNTAVVRPGMVRPGWHGAGTRWARPAGFWWRPGGAIAAGAALGMVTAATAAAWAGPAPGPNMCWYYTDSSRTKGFWDVCS